MELKNYLVELLSNIIHDKLQELSIIKKDLKKSESYKNLLSLFDDVNNIVNVNDDELKNVLSDITDSETADEIISNVDMIRIVVNGMNEGLDLSLDESQEKLIKGVYQIIDDYCSDLEKKSSDTKVYLEGFLSKCESLSSEISTGVVRDIDTLDEIFKDNNVPLSDVIKVKYEILKNNSKNYNTDVDSKVKEEVDLRIVLKKINFELDSLSDIQRQILISYGNLDDIRSMVDYICDNELSFDGNQLFILLLLSNVSILSSINDLFVKYSMNYDELFMMPGIFVSNDSKDLLNSVIDEYKSNPDFGSVSFLELIGTDYELFVRNISIFVQNNIYVEECYNVNFLSLIVPDMSKNIEILSDLSLGSDIFSIVCVNPYLATSISLFNECGLKDYVISNPLRLTTSYYRLKQIYFNIVNARKSGGIIFRSLNDKKNYWLSKDITKTKTEVV